MEGRKEGKDREGGREGWGGERVRTPVMVNNPLTTCDEISTHMSLKTIHPDHPSDEIQQKAESEREGGN